VAACTPCPGLCGVEIVDPDGGALPGEPGDRGDFVAGLERGRGHGGHRECRDPQKGSQQAVGVIVPGRGPGDVEDMQELVDPFPVRRRQANGFFPGEQVVFGEPLRAFHGAVRIEDAIDIEQQSGARHLPSMDAASRGGSRAGQRRGGAGAVVVDAAVSAGWCGIGSYRECRWVRLARVRAGQAPSAYSPCAVPG